MAIQNYGPQVEAIGIAFLTLAWISVILRSSVRVFITRLFRIDDWLAILVLGVFTLYCAFVLLGEKYGTGRFVADLSKQDLQISMKWWYCGEITYIVTTWLLKVYIGAFLMQICIRRSHILIIGTVIVAFTTLSIFYLFLMAFQCHPVSYFWTQYGIGASGKCISPTVIVDSTYVHGAFSAVSDWTLGTLPIFLIWNLQMNTRTKVMATVILSIGAIGSLATVIRIFYIHDLKTTKEFLYQNSNVAIWSTVEPGMGLIASSLACMKPLFRACFSKSGYLNSNATAPAWSPSPRRNVFSTNINGSEEIRLHKNFAKSIRVETVIETHSAQDSGDAEARIGFRPERGEIALE